MVKSNRIRHRVEMKTSLSLSLTMVVKEKIDNGNGKQYLGVIYDASCWFFVVTAYDPEDFKD